MGSGPARTEASAAGWPDVPGAGRAERPKEGRGKARSVVSIAAAAPVGARGYLAASAVRAATVIEATAASAR